MSLDSPSDKPVLVAVERPDSSARRKVARMIGDLVRRARQVRFRRRVVDPPGGGSNEPIASEHSAAAVANKLKDPAARAALLRAFNASSVELGEAAVALAAESRKARKAT